MPKEPKYSHTNPSPDYLQAVERNKAVEKREMEFKRKIKGLEKQAVGKLKKCPLNRHTRHEFELVIMDDQKIVTKYILTVRRDGHDFRIVRTDGSPIRLFDDKIKVLDVFLKRNSG